MSEEKKKEILKCPYSCDKCAYRPKGSELCKAQLVVWKGRIEKISLKKELIKHDKNE